MAVLAGCAESGDVTNPSKASSSSATPGVLPAPTQVKVVTRSVPLASFETASGLIGAFGGQLTLPNSGFTVVIPPFALTSPTQITVTAVPGSLLAYEFSPHGQQFLVPLIATQNLSGTSAAGGGILPAVLYAGYFTNVLDLDQLNGTALVSELLGTSISALGGSVSFAISHFSGYLVAMGESDGS